MIFSRIWVKKGLNESKSLPKTVLENLEGAPEIEANVATAFAFRNPKSVLSSLPEVTNFYHTGK